MKLAIADPPYPPSFSERYDTACGTPRITRRSRAQRWYGGRAPGGGNHSADFHPAADGMSGQHAAPRRSREKRVGDFLTAAMAGVLLYGALVLVPPLVRLVERATRALAG
ncbi:MAG TPA: hypothetical protein VGC04_11315 [Cellulomonas sp.]